MITGGALPGVRVRDPSGVHPGRGDCAPAPADPENGFAVFGIFFSAFAVKG